MTLPFNININQYKGVPYLRIDRALRFNGVTNAYMNRTFGTPTSTTKFTISTWVKRTKFGVAQPILGAYKSTGPTSDYCYMGFDANDNFIFYNYVASSLTMTNTAKAVFKDPAAWYHIVLAVDTSQATAANRTKLYVNGVAQVWTTQTNNLSASPWIATAGSPFTVGGAYISSTLTYTDSINAEVLFVDGQQLAATDFGTVDTATGVWQPIRYNGAYGTNGLYLTFQDNSSAAALGNDYSGNGNNLTVNAGVTLTGTNYSSVIDSPTAYDDGSITYNRGNYCVWNPYNGGSTAFVSRGGLLTTTSTANFDFTVGTIGLTSGKWYWEMTPTATPSSLAIGIVPLNLRTVSSATSVWSNTYTVGYFNTGTKYVNGTATAYGSSYAVNVVIGVALDLDAGTITFYRNNVSQGAISISLPSVTGYPYVPCMGTTVASSANTVAANYGQYPFTYTPPSGYLAVNTYNILNAAIPVVLNGSLGVASSQYTGTGAALSVLNSSSNAAGSSFKPDLVWVKSLSAALDHKWTDSVRGATNAIISNTTGAQTTDAGGVTSFDTSGFTLGSDATYNTSAGRYVGYQWLAGNGSSANSDGSIASTTSVNRKYGFSIVTYTGTGANATVGHGLGVAPGFIIIKQLTAASATNWAVYHRSLANTQYLLLNSTALAATGATYWNSTSPTSSTFAIGTSADVNTAGGTYVAYCWTPIAGYSSFDTWTGTGAAFQNVSMNLRPRFFMWKRAATGAVAGWYITDSTRQFANYAVGGAAGNGEILANATTAANNSYDAWLTSNGIITASAQTYNASTVFVYAAFAENPFTIARAF